MKDKLTIKKSYHEGHVRVALEMSVHGHSSGSIKMFADCDLSVLEARALAASLIAEADLIDAKVAKKEAEKQRRAKWLEREVAAGRRKIMSVSEFFGR